MRSRARFLRVVRPEGRAWVVSSWASLAMLVVLGPHAVGGVHPWAIVLLACTAWLALACTTLALPAEQRRLPKATWLAFGLLAWTAVQALFLPCGLVRWVAPTMAEQAAQAWALVSGTPMTSCALSADPGNSREELLKWSGIVCAYLASLLWARAGRGRRVMTLVALSALGLALSALGHFAANAHQVYGLYTPEHVGSASLGPVLNANCLGGFLVLGAGVSIGLAGPSADRRARVFFVIAAIIDTCVAMLTLSRGAVGAAFLLAFLLALRAILRRGARGQRRERVSRAAVPAAGLLGGGAMASWLAAEPISKAVADHDLSKLLIWKYAWPVVWDHPILGIGRGAFSAVFTAYYGSTERFVYVENFPLQWAAEWGLPVALALFAWLVFRIGEPLLFARSGFRYSAAAALLVYGVQNLFDIGLELMAPALVAAVALAALRRRSRRAPERGAFHPAALLLSLLPVFGVTTWGVMNSDVRTLTAVMQTADRERPSPASRARYESALQRGLRLHPQEVVLPYYAGARALRLRDSRTPKFINRAMALAPLWVGPHVLAARFLWTLGRRVQAADALRRAMAISPGSAFDVACGLARQAPELLLRILPEGPNLRGAIEGAGACLSEAHPIRATLDQRLIDTFPDEVGAYVRQAHRLKTQGKSGEAEAFLFRELGRSPKKVELWATLANMALAQGEPKQALSLVERGEAAAGFKDALVTTKLQVLSQLGRDEEARKTWARLMAMSPKDAGSLARMYGLLGSVEETLGNRGQALAAYMQAHRLGGQVDYLVKGATLAEAIGEREQARRLWQRICTLDPQRAEACAGTKTAPATAAQPRVP